MARYLCLLVLFALGSTAAIGSDNLKYGTPSEDGVIIDRKGYALCYSEEHEQASWVSYELTDWEVTTKRVKRTSAKFAPDPKIDSGTATNADYKGSGYDRGHLAPAADMAWNKTAMKECFYYSNMSPQAPQFNRGIWKDLEEQVRGFAEELKTIYVVTGPVLFEGLPVIGKNGIAVPEAYYKCLLYDEDGDVHAIGFLLPNEGSDEPLDAFVTPIDIIEEATGLDFFSELPDSLEAAVESDIIADWWFY